MEMGLVVTTRPLALFEGYGIEIEYVIVDAQTLDVLPIADRLIEAECGAVENDVVRGAFAWSNELARHLIEIKTSAPAASLSGLADGFMGEVARIDALLAPHGARLLSTAMHPWMEPLREFALWPHGDAEIYAAFDRIFDCRGHGWANLQSAQLNLPFADDDEFGRLHAAARALLPLLPALAAASPFVEGRHLGLLDARLDVVRHNSGRIPSLAGALVPEPIFTRADYCALLDSLYADLAPHDPERILCHEWVNARGAIARFDRMALEIRVLDVQECPRADLAVAFAVSRTLQALCDPAPAHQSRLRALATAPLADLLTRTTAQAEEALVDDTALLRALGLDGAARSAREVWRELFARHLASDPAGAEYRDALEVLLEEGCLARRILRRIGEKPPREALAALYRELAACLREGRMLRPGA
jgi:gamma-glutamyl:cysteine ligase YbdK (ATP-grasp superfamily)